MAATGENPGVLVVSGVDVVVAVVVGVVVAVTAVAVVVVVAVVVGAEEVFTLIGWGFPSSAMRADTVMKPGLDV